MKNWVVKLGCVCDMVVDMAGPACLEEISRGSLVVFTKFVSPSRIDNASSISFTLPVSVNGDDLVVSPEGTEVGSISLLLELNRALSRSRIRIGCGKE